MAKEVFGRYEAKFLLSEAQFHKFHNEIKSYLSLDPYNQNNEFIKIYNLYADTQDDNVIRTSIDKPMYKEKIRIRSYQHFKQGDMVFLEVKKKYNRFVNKRRTKIKYEDALCFVETGVIPTIQPYMNEQVMKELAYIINQEKLYLKTYLTYDRIAYFSKDQDDLRITFDTNVKGKRIDSEMIDIIPDKMWLMEIKAEKSFPLWLVKLLSKHKLYRTSFSKYGKAYEYYVKKQKQNVYTNYQMNTKMVQEEMKNVGNAIQFKY